MHLPNGGTIATRNKTTQASLAWLVRFSIHITWCRWHDMRWNARTVSRDRSRGSECSSLEISRFKRSLSFSFSLSSSLGSSSRALRVAGPAGGGAQPGCCERSSGTPARWQFVLRSRQPSAVGATHLKSGKMSWLHENPRSYHKETLLQIPSFLLIHRTIRLLIEDIIKWWLIWIVEKFNNTIIDTVEKKLCTSYPIFILKEEFEKLLLVWWTLYHSIIFFVLFF